MKYSFPAIFKHDPETENAINVEFPDFFGAYTFGMGDDEAYEMAQDLLKLLLADHKNRKVVPSSTELFADATGVVKLVEVEV